MVLDPKQPTDLEGSSSGYFIYIMKGNTEKSMI